jgi:hypothetical protein
LECFGVNRCIGLVVSQILMMFFHYLDNL